MAMMTGKEYVESLRAMKLRVYMFGKRVEKPRGRSHPPPLGQLRSDDL